MNKIFMYLIMSSGLILMPPALAEGPIHWTLSASIERAVKIAPEMKSADAEIDKQKAKLQQAKAWPNPDLSIQVDNALGLEDSAGGYDVTEFSISQSLPFRRLRHQRRQANAGLARAVANRGQQQLLLEYQVAKRFHALQLSSAEMALAEKRLQQAGRYQGTGNKRRGGDALVRYLTPLETMRLDIVLQAAKQIVEVAEGEHNEAATSFTSLLGLAVDSNFKLVPLAPVPAPQTFTVLQSSLQNHPALEADKQAVASSRASVAVAKAKRFSDPVLTLYRGQGIYSNRRQESTGIMLSLQVPLWNVSGGSVSQARHSVRQSQAALLLRQRDLRTNLQKSSLHLGHLIDQAEHYRNKLLQPALKVFTLTRKGFSAGEINILSLIDANNIYFDARARYLELLQEGWLELAEVRKSAGLFHSAQFPATRFDEVK